LLHRELSFSVSCFISHPAFLFTGIELASVRDVQKENESEIKHFHIPAEARDFSLPHIAQTGYGTHAASYPVSNEGLFPRVKVAGA
jgi:hypothetical protein